MGVWGGGGLTAGPGGPAGPVKPLSPMTPCSPWGPGEPFSPSGPSGPAGPLGPTFPLGPWGEGGSHDSRGSTLPHSLHSHAQPSHIACTHTLDPPTQPCTRTLDPPSQPCTRTLDPPSQPALTCTTLPHSLHSGTHNTPTQPRPPPKRWSACLCSLQALGALVALGSCASRCTDWSVQARVSLLACKSLGGEEKISHQRSRQLRATSGLRTFFPWSPLSPRAPLGPDTP